MNNFIKRHKQVLAISMIMIISSTFGLFAYAVDYGTELKNSPTKQYEQKFSDVTKDYWAFSFIGEMIERKVLNGYPDGLFRPDDMVTRAEFAKIIVNAASLKVASTGRTSFADVSTKDWCNPFIETAKSYLTGFRDPNGAYLYKPDAPALREDIAIAIVKIKGYDTTIVDRSLIEKMFKDIDSISESAKDYVALAVEKGLISGYPDSTFRGQDSITRAEAATLLWRAYQYGNANKEVSSSANPQPTIAPTTIPSTTTAPVEDPYAIAATPTPTPVPTPKYAVTTLFGGNGTGSADGTAITAQINSIDSMVSDKDGNIYFIDSGKIRKYTKTSKRVDTFLTIDSRFTTKDNDGKTLDYSKFKPQVLCYDYSNNALLLAGAYDYDMALFVIAPTVKFISLVNKGFDNRSCLSMAITEDGVVMMNRRNYTSELYRVTVGSSKLIASEKDNQMAGTSSTAIYSMSYSQGTLLTSNFNYFWYNQIYPPKYSKLSDVSCDASTSQNGSFYYVKGDTFYKMTLDGNSTVILTTKDLNYDGTPIKKLSRITFDFSGNLVCYDKSNNAVYRITTLELAQPPEVVKCVLNPAPAPVATPEPTATPVPSATPAPTPTPELTVTPIPSTTPIPTVSPVPAQEATTEL